MQIYQETPNACTIEAVTLQILKLWLQQAGNNDKWGGGRNHLNILAMIMGTEKRKDFSKTLQVEKMTVCFPIADNALIAKDKSK